MSKRKITILAAVAVLALGLTAGVVLAQGGGDGDTGPAETFAGRVAVILGLEEATVQSAFTKARRQEEDAAYQGRLDRMVEGGRLTQEEADARFTWFQGRPDSAVSEHGWGRQPFRGGESRRGHNGRFGFGGPEHGRRGGGTDDRDGGHGDDEDDDRDDDDRDGEGHEDDEDDRDGGGSSS